MEIHKKILLILIIIIASIILYRLWTKRVNIETDIAMLNKKVEPEPFTSNGLMETFNDTFNLNQYFIKASWNTAYTGPNNAKYKSNIMDISMVIDVMNSGCRFLDFEIYSIQTTIGKNTNKSVSKVIIEPVVGFSNQVNNNYQMECNEPTVKLVDILTTISQNAFMVTNGKDPLFVQLRVKSANIELYKSLLSIIKEDSAFGKTVSTKHSMLNVKTGSQLIQNQKLSNLKGKIFLIADLENSDPMFTRILTYNMYGNVDDTKTDYTSTGTGLIPGFQSMFSSYTTKRLHMGTLSNLSNSKVLSLPSTPYDIDTSGNITFILCPPSNNPYIFNESYPDFSIFNLSNIEKISIYNLVINHTIHILPFRFYIDDGNLADYENIFTDNGKCAFVKMGTVIDTYSKELSKGLYGKSSNYIQY
jgi:hypothetical protein